MWTDVVDLNAFYRSKQGRIARSLLEKKIRHLWPNVSGQAVAGFGYATPYLKQFRGEAERVVAVMPANQGVTHWPRAEQGLVALAEETQLPLSDLSIDRLLLVHSLENSERMREALRECWRVLNGVGKMIVVAPARRGFWSRNERTPFGHGKPFSHGQLSRLLRDCQFEPGESDRALYLPPSASPLMHRFSKPMERLGERLFTRFGGVLMVEATKQIYAASTARPVARRRLVVVPGAVGVARSHQ
ncbi:MAG: methyltransferase domain-containing protein [Alphaproteobacteria bacterium]|nr:methyltransferase domain-containing protein [Alphaproteobacteria bacterium]